MTDDTARHEFLDAKPLLAPKSIAIIGASDQPGNLGGVAIRLLQKFGYPGTLWPVNPRRPDVHGIACHARVADLPAAADLALFATGAESLPDLVRECAAAGTRCGIAWAGGFAETGEAGRSLQEELVRACRQTGFALCGPNCIGIINTWMPMTASFASFLTEIDALRPGDISFVSQSGGLATMAQAFAQKAGFGFRTMISSGNEAVLDTADFVNALVEDPGTRIIAVYIEGLRNGGKFRTALARARSAGKPVVVLKGGQTPAAARAAASHTGALAGERRVWQSVFREAAAIEVQSLEEMLDVLLFLTSNGHGRLPAGPGVAIVTFGGGGGVLSADQCARNGLAATLLTDTTRDRLRPLVPPIAAVENPVDLTPTVYNQAKWFALFEQALDTIASDPGIDSILLLFGPMALRGPDVARAVCAFRRRSRKPVCVAWPLAPLGIPEMLLADGIHVYTEGERAIRTLGKLARRAAEARVPPAADVAPLVFDWASFVTRAAAGTVVPEPACHRILAGAGLAVAPGRLAHSADDAVESAAAVGYPVALKGISPAVTHRAAAGLLALGLGAAGEVRETWHELARLAASSDITLDGIYVQHMIAGGTEVLVSAFRDPVFGTFVSCGAGGNLTELLDDVTLASAPIDEARALAMIDRLRITHHASNSKRPPDRQRLADWIVQFSRLAAGAPWRRFVLEVNPVKWSHDGVTAVDGLLIIEEP